MGTLEWTKTIGDTNLLSQQYLQPYFLLPIQTNEWMSFYSTPDDRYYFHLAKTDSLLNGFCNYSQSNIQSSTLTFQQFDYTATSYPENYTISDGIFSESPNLMTERIECSTTNFSNGDYHSFSFSIFPNPVSSFAYLRIDNPEEFSYYTIIIFNIQGVQILTLPLENKMDSRIDLSALEDGLYFYFISENKLPILTSKIIILK